MVKQKSYLYKNNSNGQSVTVQASDILEADQKVEALWNVKIVKSNIGCTCLNAPANKSFKQALAKEIEL